MRYFILFGYVVPIVAVLLLLLCMLSRYNYKIKTLGLEETAKRNKGHWTDHIKIVVLYTIMTICPLINMALMFILFFDYDKMVDEKIAKLANLS